MRTKEICATLLTKPVQGHQFVKELEDLTGWTVSITAAIEGGGVDMWTINVLFSCF